MKPNFLDNPQRWLRTPRTMGEAGMLADKEPSRRGWEDRVVLACLLVTLVVVVLTGCGPSTTRDSDNDMLVYTDSGTGCQYLRPNSTNPGGLTPRMGADGKQVCK